MAWGTIPLNELKERQGRRLHQFLAKKVIPYSPYYRELFKRLKLDADKLRSIGDLRHLPFTSKADLLPTDENPTRFRDFVLQPTPGQLRGDMNVRDKVVLFARSQLFARGMEDLILDEYLPVMATFTTGRSTMPINIVYTRHDIDNLRTAGQRLLKVSGLDRRTDGGHNAFPYAPHLGFWQVAYAGEAAGIFMMHSGGGKVMGSQMILNMMTRGRATFLMGTPGYVMHLVQLALEQGRELKSLRRVILGAERAGPEYKAKLREKIAQWGSPDVKIQVTYGMTEAKKAWMETADAPDSRFAMYPDFEIIEIINPETGEPVAEGEPGEIVLTHICGSGTCLLRYRTGDRVKEGLVYEKCKYTGLMLPLLGTTVYRVSDIKKVKGTLVDFNELFGYFGAQKEIAEWQLVVSKPQDNPFGNDIIHLKLALVEGTDMEAFKRRVASEFHTQTEVGLDEITFMDRAQMAHELGMETQSKEKRIVDERPA
jgi:phenylacetate-coenzyme A ligase PaaK-like adenylate-forming protein